MATTRTNNPPEAAIQALRALREAVSAADIAKKLRITRQAVGCWHAVPAEHVKPISVLTGIPPHELRPDLYDPPNSRRKNPRVAVG
jgi:hypothetical protein